MCWRRGGAGAGGGSGPGGSGLARQRPLFSSPFSPPLKGQALGAPGGKREGLSGPLATVTPQSRGHFSPPPPPGLWGGLLGERRERAGVVAELWRSPSPSPPGSPGGASFTSGVGLSLVAGPSLFPLLLMVSGACGTEGRESGTRAPLTPARSWTGPNVLWVCHR